MQSMPQSELSQQLVQNSRTNLRDLKSQIGRRVGRERAQLYLLYLNGLLTQKLSKPEFNKLCLFTIGRENLPLHNQLIWSILSNACQAKEPPPFNHERDTQKLKAAFSSLGTPTTSLHISSNGIIPHPPPCKFSTGLQCRYAKGATSFLVPGERLEVAPHQSQVSSAAKNDRDNGDLGPIDLKQLRYQQDRSVEHLAKKPRLDKLSLHDQISSSVKDLVQVETLEWGDRLQNLKSCRGSLRAPLGIPFCSASIGGARRYPLRTVASSRGGSGSSYVCRHLCPEILKNRMEKIAESQGLGGVTLECSNLLNDGLDAYLKQLISCCVKLVRARNGNRLTKQQVPLQQPFRNPTTGIKSISRPSEVISEMKNCLSMSIHDFKAAMALNLQVLGEDWPLLHEKICLYSFEE